MQNKILDIQKLLKYLVENNYYFVREISKNIYDLDGFGSQLVPNLEAYDKRDKYEYTINFKDKKLSVYAFSINNHNGDHCECYIKELDFNKIILLRSSLESIVRNIIKTNLINQQWDNAINTKFDSILEK